MCARHLQTIASRRHWEEVGKKRAQDHGVYAYLYKHEVLCWGGGLLAVVSLTLVV